ncbi:MAG: hypothetical protein IJM51_04860 [Clostridia bacterium]|nr:hypothetical protein [Clostridia bacterium]
MNRIFLKIASIAAAVAVLFSLTACNPEKRSGAAQYDKSYYITKYGGDLDSNLSVFPDSVEEGRVALFESSFGEGLFDTDGYMILEYRCDAEQIAAEEERLGGIAFTIKNHDGKTFTNHVMDDEKSYPYPAYITNDGFGSTYEYALIDRGGNRIIYIYAAYVMPDGFPCKEYLKTDRSAYKADSLQAFTVYNHSFDGGQSWMEFDDVTDH